MMELNRDPKYVASQLLLATYLPDEQIFRELDAPCYTDVDYYRMACHILFKCQRCGNCCTTGDPIRLRQEDVALLAKGLKIPLNKAFKKFTVKDPKKAGVYNFKHILPCKFYDQSAKGCRIYQLRPWSCRIFPFLGIYGSEDRVVVNELCPGSVRTMEILKEAILEVRPDANRPKSNADDADSDVTSNSTANAAVVRSAKLFLREALKSI
ncbi:MAG TPA: YkgJ family cysteine cluster protein [Methanothrix sp.]|nr:YkgJ family cysteine cluster protein [Methanothrix sp.]